MHTRTFLAVQWLGPGASIDRVLVQSLVGELRSHMPCNMATTKNLSYTLRVGGTAILSPYSPWLYPLSLTESLTQMLSFPEHLWMPQQGIELYPHPADLLQAVRGSLSVKDLETSSKTILYGLNCVPPHQIPKLKP